MKKPAFVLFSRGKCLVLFLMVSFFSLPLWAGVRFRWHLTFENSVPALFTYQDALGRTRNFWYFTYTLSYKLSDEEKKAFDTLKEEGGAKVIPPPVSLSGLEMMIRSYPRDKTYFWKYYPEVERKIIIHLEKMRSLPLGWQVKAIRKLKAQNKYLDQQDIKWILQPQGPGKERQIQEGQTLQGLAIFDNLTPWTTQFDVEVVGLVDPLKPYFPRPRAQEEWEKESPGEKKRYDLETQIFVGKYDLPGGPYQGYQAMPVFKSKAYEIHSWGPLASKKTVEHLLQGLAHDNLLVRTSVYHLLEMIFSPSMLNSFNPKLLTYHPSQSPDEKGNKESLSLWKEWWFRNEDRLVYEAEQNQFVLSSPAPSSAEKKNE